jgi:glucokinase
MNVIGIDIGGTKIAGCVMEAATGIALHSETVPTEAERGGASVLARAVALARRLSQAAPCTAIGVGAGGQIDHQTGVVLSAVESILPGWAGLNLKQAFEEALPLPTTVDNDVNALASGECRFGAGRGKQYVLFLALGTGVGGAIVSEGRLYRGAWGFGGEPGHLYLAPGETMESRCAGPALYERYLHLGGDATVPAHDLLTLAERDEDSHAARAIHAVGTDLGWGITSLVNILNPECVILGGGLLTLGEHLLAPARAVVAAHALPLCRTTPILPAALGKHASVLGAASLALT